MQGIAPLNRPRCDRESDPGLTRVYSWRTKAPRPRRRSQHDYGNPEGPRHRARIGTPDEDAVEDLPRPRAACRSARTGRAALGVRVTRHAVIAVHRQPAHAGRMDRTSRDAA